MYEELGSSRFDMIKVVRDNLVVHDFTQQKGPGTLITGQVGSGKTTRLVEMIKHADHPLVLHVIYEQSL